MHDIQLEEGGGRQVMIVLAVHLYVCTRSDFGPGDCWTTRTTELVIQMIPKKNLVFWAGQTQAFYNFTDELNHIVTHLLHKLGKLLCSLRYLYHVGLGKCH